MAIVIRKMALAIVNDGLVLYTSFKNRGTLFKEAIRSLIVTRSVVFSDDCPLEENICFQNFITLIN
jgi:hypothetical protein